MFTDTSDFSTAGDGTPERRTRTPRLSTALCARSTFWSSAPRSTCRRHHPLARRFTRTGGAKVDSTIDPTL